MTEGSIRQVLRPKAVDFLDEPLDIQSESFNKEIVMKVLSSLIVLLAAAGLFGQSAEPTRLLRYPDIHQDQVVFTYGGDLWLGRIGRLETRRLTSHAGIEYLAKFSPDGKNLAFTASYDGNEDVYLMSVDGGEPRRLTHHPDREMVVDWTPDGKSILFRSHRQSGMSGANRLYLVSPEGGFPRVLPLPAGELASYSPDGQKLAYNRISREFRTWKRYKGGMAQDIWLYDFAGNKIERLTDFEGTDAFPMWQGEGIYFVSDRDSGMVMNLFVHDLAGKAQTQLTRFDTYDVKWPSQGPGAIVFENGGDLYRYDLDKARVEKLAFRVDGDFPELRPQYKNVSGYVHRAALAQDGGQAVVEARGDLFLHSPVGKKSVDNLTRTSGARESYPAFDATGKKVAYFSDESGEHELYVRTLADRSVRQITRGGHCYRAAPVWSPDGSKILFSDAMVRLYYAELTTGKVTEVAHGEYARATNFIGGVWSPDSAWIAYAKPEANQLYAVYLYEIKTGKSTRVTDQLSDNRDPRFSDDGGYLYFVANRQMGSTWGSFDVTQLVTDKPGRLAGVTLQAGLTPPKEETAQPATRKGPMRLDLAGIEDRLFPLGVEDGYFVGLSLGGNKLFYVKAGSTDTSPDAFPDDPRTGPLCVFDPVKGKETELLTGVDEFSVSSCGAFVLVRQGQSWSRLEVAGKDLVPLKLDAQMMVVDPRAEWKEIFNEAWMQFRDWFYDPNFHGIDWAAMKERYGCLLPHAAHRDDLNYLIGEMIAELSCSHTYRGGGDHPVYPRQRGGLLGCDYQLDEGSGRYRITTIFSGNRWSQEEIGPLARPGLKVKEGDYLLKVDGRELKAPETPEMLLLYLAGRETTIEVADDAAGANRRTAVVTPVSYEGGLRYLHEVARKQRLVQERSGGRIGYVHLANTMYDGYAALNQGIYGQGNAVQGFIFDGRWNGGGLIPEMFIEKLDRPMLFGWVTRATTGWRTPAFSFQGAMAYLINGFAGSGGDAMPYSFRKRGLGPLIGTRTWGGLVGISGNPRLMDNGSISVADFAVHDEKGNWVIENRGVEPDIEVDDRPDLVIAGQDPTLERAIEEVLKAIEAGKGQGYQKPKEFPDRRGKR